MKKSLYRVLGMGCEACVKRVEKAVSSVEGVSSVQVDLAAQTLTTEYDESKIDYSQLKNAVEEAGYELEEIE